MVRVTDDLALSPDNVFLYHASDALLGHQQVLIFYGPSTTANYTLNSSRVQIHVFSQAGFRSFPRLTISPNSASYVVVDCLPREFQGDELYRGLAFGLFKYFNELPSHVRNLLQNAYHPKCAGPTPLPTLFGAQHAADVVVSMAKSDKAASVVAHLRDAFRTQHVSNIDVDLVLPPGAIVPLSPSDLEHVSDDEDGILDPTLRQYAGYKAFIKPFGEPVFLPTSKIRRAPSKPSSLNRSKSISRDQKYELRMKLAELVDTEERYVVKLGELVHQVAKEFRESAKRRLPGSPSPSEEELEKLFPRSADRILQVNSAFMEQLRCIMDETEEEAVQDMNTATVNFKGSKGGGSSQARDPSGVLAMSWVFLEWFPRFSRCYQEYIKASQHFPSLLNSFLNQQSSFKQRVNQAGEQAVRSILIEPVQRLPRYNLFIDQIVATLPMTHPALQPMLKARDIITSICSMDDPLPGKSHVARRLQSLIDAWPTNLEPQGRLIQVIDYSKLVPPYSISHDDPGLSGTFLLFADCVVILDKVDTSMTGRDLLKDIERPSAADLLYTITDAIEGSAPKGHRYNEWHKLSDLRFTESSDGSMVWMILVQKPGSDHKLSSAPRAHCFFLQDAFEGKASKLMEIVSKARIEARFSEAEREDPCWTLRSVQAHEGNLDLHVAVFQDAALQLVEGRQEPAPVRIVFDYERGTKGAPVGHYGVEIVVNVSSIQPGRVMLLTVGLHGKQFQDDVEVEEFLPTMSRRVTQLLSMQSNTGNPTLSPALVSFYIAILHGLSLSSRAEKTRSILATSPVKLLTNLWTGNTHTQPAEPIVSVSKQPQTPTPGRSNSQRSVFGSHRGNFAAVQGEEERPENPLVRLEQTFSGYVAALQRRKGSIIGRMLLNRSMVDELSVNDLYNRLIENPFDWFAAEDLGTEVIFTAFEKFLRIAWTEQIGPVMTMQALDHLQERANKRVPGNFADFVNYLFKEMAPQNRRAFAAVIKLLADLLDGCGNDSDRGALTLAFAELLVLDGTAPNYINLLDRLMEDCERIFDDAATAQGSQRQTPATGSMSSISRLKTQTASVTSNASSLRRKFGLEMLLRQNLKDERPSVWRSLSKHRNPATGESSSLSRAVPNRAHSIDDGSIPRRVHGKPPSHERPPIAGAFDEVAKGTLSAHRPDLPLDTIGEPAEERKAQAPTSDRRKRRSSLSDLKDLMAAATIQDGPMQPLQTTKQMSVKVNAAGVATESVKTSLLSRIPLSPQAAQSLRSPLQKENMADPFSSAFSDVHAGGLLKKQGSPPSKVDASRKTTSTRQLESPPKRKGHFKTFSTSRISNMKSMRPATSESDSMAPPSSPSRNGTQRLRLQSPQKLRERLKTDKKTSDDIDASLRHELAKIGKEMALVNKRRHHTQSPDVQQLAASVRSFEDRLPSALQEVRDKQARLQRDLETTTRSLEKKLESLDQLHKEAVAENELLYEKFNHELGKIVRALKGKGREDKEEVTSRLKEQSEEAAQLKENAQLKRELVSLRAVHKGTE